MVASHAHLVAATLSMVILHALLYTLATGQWVILEPLTRLMLVAVAVQSYLLTRVYRVASSTPGMEPLAREAIKGVLVNAVFIGIAYPVVVTMLAWHATRIYERLREAGVMIDPRPGARLLLLLALWPVTAPLVGLVSGEKLEAMRAISVYASMPLGWEMVTPGGEKPEGSDSGLRGDGPLLRG